MTSEEFESQCRVLCPLCAQGRPVRYRPETRETVHDDRFGVGGISITLCRANDFRNENAGKF